MTRHGGITRCSVALAAAMLFVTGGIRHAAGQADSGKAPGAQRDTTKRKELSAFWKATTPFALTLSVDLKTIKGDRKDGAPWRPASVSFTDGAGGVKRLAARVRTRGLSRLTLCDTPPLWVDFTGEGERRGGPFAGVGRFKLTVPCKSGDVYDSYVVEELNLYRVSALFTELTHQSRLLKLTLFDSVSKKEVFTRWAFATDDVDDVAARFGGIRIDSVSFTSEGFDTYQTTLMGVLAYFMGNTDYSFAARHNSELIRRGEVLYPVLYDYDNSGVINTRYSVPSSILGIRRVTQRLYRGLCAPKDTLTKVLTAVRDKRPQITALYSDEIGKLIDAGRAKTALEYIDEFYKTIDDPRQLKREIEDKCRKLE